MTFKLFKLTVLILFLVSFGTYVLSPPSLGLFVSSFTLILILFFITNKGDWR